MNLDNNSEYDKPSVHSTSVRDATNIVLSSIHWLTAALVVLAWALVVFDDLLPSSTAYVSSLSVHIAIGLTIVDLLTFRLLIRALNVQNLITPSELVSRPHALSKSVGIILRYCLYVLLFAVPLAGIVLQFARGSALPIYGIIDIPSPWTANVAFASIAKDAHEILAHCLLGLSALHAVSALVDSFAFGDRALAKMLPLRQN